MGSEGSRMIRLSASAPSTNFEALDAELKAELNSEEEEKKPQRPNIIVSMKEKSAVAIPFLATECLCFIPKSLRFQSQSPNKWPGPELTRLPTELAYCKSLLTLPNPESSLRHLYSALYNYRMPASRIVGSFNRQVPSLVAKVYTPSQQRVQQELDAFRDQMRLPRSKVAAGPYRREAQSAQPKYRWVGEAFAGFQGHGNNVAQLEAHFSQSHAGAAKSRVAAKMIEQNWNPAHKVAGGIESRQQNSVKVEVERVGDIKANLTSRITAKDVLEIRELEPLSREEERRSSPFSERGVNLHGSRDSSRDTAQGSDSMHLHSGGTTNQAIAVLQNRLQRGISTDYRMYGKVLQTSLKQKDLLAAKQVHDCIIRSGMHKNVHLAVTLLNVYIKFGELVDARRVFDQLAKKSVATWTNMISGYAKSDHAASALELFNQMRQEGVEPNDITYLSVLKACAGPLALKWGKGIHECIRHAGFESDVRVGTALLKMYAESGSIDVAREVFDKMERRDVVSWTVMIGGLAQHGCGHEAYRLFRQMRREGFEPDVFTYVSILNASASDGALEWVKRVHGHASKAGLESDVRVGTALVNMYAKSGSVNDARLVFDRIEKPNVFTWTVMMGGLAQHGCGHEAYRLFLQMRRKGFEPDVITYLSILNASASAGALAWVKEVHGHASKAGLESDVRVGNALVHMYAESGSIDDAREVFDKMEKRNVVSWTVMIGGLAQHGCGHEALELFRKMNSDHVKPNGISLVAVLSACCHGGLVDDGRRLFSAMTQDFGIEPNIVHYTCMVDLLGRAGHLEEAGLFISKMPLEPNGVTWTALLGACRTYGNVELAEVAAKELLKLEPSNPATYVLLSNIYAAAGKWEHVSLVRSMMETRGIWKEPGCSWIEVDNNIHEFVVGDTSHPEAKEIYTELNELTEKLKAEGYIPDTRFVLHDINEDDKELALCSHSEKLAIAYGLIHIPREEPIRVWKNLRVCSDCHTVTKLISKVTGREIIARDLNRFHRFKDGVCSCGDYW